MKAIREKRDIYPIKNPYHKHSLLVYFEEVMKPIYATGSPDNDGWMVYFEKGDDLFQAVNPEAHFFSSEGKGIYQETYPGVNGWEAVDLLDDLYVVTVVMNNSFAITYFVPNEDWVDPILLNELSVTCNGHLTHLEKL